jgi:uncharacterized protein YbjQ (UPF0145 family)
MGRVLFTRNDAVDGYRITKRLGEIRCEFYTEQPLFNFEGDSKAYKMAYECMEEKAISMGGNAVIRFRMQKTDRSYPGSTRVVRAYPFPSPLDYTPGGRRVVHTPGYNRTEYTFFGYVVLMKKKVAAQAAAPKNVTNPKRRGLFYCHICGLPFRREIDLKSHLDNWHR